MNVREQIAWLLHITASGGYCDEWGNPVDLVDVFDVTRRIFHVRHWLYARIANSGYTNKIPPALTKACTLNGCMFFIYPSWSTKSRRRCIHRAFIECPVCAKLISVGRFRQHVGRADHKDYTN